MLKNASQHSFHIPVMGLSYTVDTPVKVAQFGISSVVSIMDDHLWKICGDCIAAKIIWNTLKSSLML